MSRYRRRNDVFFFVRSGFPKRSGKRGRFHFPAGFKRTISHRLCRTLRLFYCSTMGSTDYYIRPSSPAISYDWVGGTVRVPIQLTAFSVFFRYRCTNTRAYCVEFVSACASHRRLPAYGQQWTGAAAAVSRRRNSVFSRAKGNRSKTFGVPYDFQLYTRRNDWHTRRTAEIDPSGFATP